MKARVTVTLKTGILDPQGKAIEGAAPSDREGLVYKRHAARVDPETLDS